MVTSDTGARYVPSWEAIKQGCKCPTLIYWSFFNKKREIYLTHEGYSPIPSGKGAYFREPIQHDNVLGGLNYCNQLLGKVDYIKKKCLEAIYLGAGHWERI